jgi:hypothetical protein
MPLVVGPRASRPSGAMSSFWVIGGAGFIALISTLYFMHDTVIVDLGYRHFATIFGLPAAAAAALLVVLVTRAVSGPMSVEFLGLKFHGAASEAIMWVLCFLAIAYAVGSTWKLEYEHIQGGG